MGTEERLKALEKITAAYLAATRFTTFILEDGSEFHTTLDPLEYLMAFGADTPKGKIASYPYPTEGVDALSISICESINDEIRTGYIRRLIKEIDDDEVE